MKEFIKSYWKTILFFTLVGLIGGFFTGLYILDSYPASIQQQILDQGINNIMLGILTAFQSAGYGLVLGTLGIILGKKIGLFKNERIIEKKPLIYASIISIIGGIGIIVPDFVFFGKYSQIIMDSYASKPTIDYMIAMVTYGGILEEVMLRLFMMSLIAYILYLLFERNKDKPSAWIFVSANIISAILFALGHLPATFLIIGITPMIILRCFLLNGTFGLMFGWLYRKYGLRYAMIAHMGCHIISKLIWIIFI